MIAVPYIKGILDEEKSRLENKKEHYEKRLESLPKGSIVYKKINDKKYPYLVFRENKKVVTKYISKNELNAVLEQLEDRKRVKEALKNINENLKYLSKIK